MYLNVHRPGTGKQSIISLVPSQTELLHYLGLEKEVVGITKFCVHPAEWFRSKTKVGGTKTIDIEKIRSLRPTLIIANKEENVQSQVEALSEFPVWLTDVNKLEDACEMIADLGRITGTLTRAEIIINEIREGLRKLVTPNPPLRVAYLIWNDPFMTVGGDTFIHDMITRTGMRNIFEDRRRYPEVSIDDIKKAGCEVLLLSSEPYPFKEKHVAALAALLPGVLIKLVDGEMFSWYGSRLVKSANYFKNLQLQFLTPARLSRSGGEDTDPHRFL